MAGASATPPRRPHELPPLSSAVRPPAPLSLATSSQVGPQLSLEAVLSAHAEAVDPVMSALEQAISERNALASQNTQLWKLIEKSRGLYTESQRNLERVRLERDAYKAMLSKLGENPDAIARGHRARERQLKPSPSNNGIRQGSDGYPSPSPSAAPSLPTRHQSADTGLAADAESHSLTPGWLPGSKVPPTVTVSHPSLSTLDPFATQAVSGSPPHQQLTTKPLNIPKVDDRLGTDAGLSTSPASLSASPSNNYPPNGSSATSPLETITPSSRSGQQSLAQPQAIGRELRVTLPEEAKQYTSSVADSPADSPLARAIELNHGRRGLSPTRSNAPPVPDPRDSATDKSMRRDLSDGEFLDLDDSDSLYDSAADYSLTSPSPQDSRKPPDDPKQPRVSIQSPAADDFPLPPGIANPGNPGNSNLIPGTSQATPAVERARRMDGPESPTTPTPNAYGSRLSTYQSVIPEQESLVQFRALPLLPYDLPYTNVTVTTSSIRPNDRGKDVLSFVVLVNPGNQKDPYMVEKLYSDVLGLDQRIRSRYGKIILKKIPHLPDGKLWRDHAPSKVDQRKAILEHYVQALIKLPVKNNDEIIAFLTSDVIKETNKPVAREGYKEGYLTKRGKNFGGWKTRFFVLQGPQLEYYESRGGQHLGAINITGAQIGRQHRPADRRESEDEGEYRHAFLIIELKKGTGATQRHVLCAESDSERDSWVQVLVRYVSGSYDEHASPHSSLYINTSATTSMSSSQPRSSTSSNPPVEFPPPYRERRQGQRGMKEDINVSSAVPLSRLAPDPSNPKLFHATHPYEEASGRSSNTPSSSEQSAPLFSDAQTAKRLLDKGQPLHAHGAESPMSSSLPTTSPLDAAGGDFTPSIGPRPNSELGHYTDLIEPQGSRGGGRNPPPSSDHPRHRQGQRTSLHPSLEPQHSSDCTLPGDRPASPEGLNQSSSRTDMPTKVKISGPMNGTPIPLGHKFGSKEPEVMQSDRRDKVKSRMFQWGWRQHGEKPNAPAHAQVHRMVFGIPLEESLEVANIAGLPSIVFRCIEYLEKMEADQEEGIYRLSGSSAVIKNLKDKFNAEGDVDLLREDEYWDPHAIAGLLKCFFRDLPSSILTRDLHMRFLSVMDLVDPQERITELSHLIAILPVANYSLLRALTAHLISVVQNANVNKMTMRNVGIVFSPTLGIPAGVFSLMLGEFNRVFNVNDDANEAETAADEMESPVSRVADASSADINPRNSKHYLDATTDQLLGLSGRQLTGPEEDGQSDDEEDMSVNTESGADTTDQDTLAESSQSNPQQQSPSIQEPIPSSRSRASNLAAVRGLGIHVASSDASRQGQVSGLPLSPRPPGRSPRSSPNPQDAAISGASAPSQ